MRSSPDFFDRPDIGFLSIKYVLNDISSCRAYQMNSWLVFDPEMNVIRVNHLNHCARTKFQSFITHTAEIMTNDTSRKQMKAIMKPSIRLGFNRFMANSRQSVKTCGGISFLNAKTKPSRMKMRWSRYPKIGMESRSLSMGLKAYPMTQTMRIFAYQGTRGSL